MQSLCSPPLIHMLACINVNWLPSSCISLSETSQWVVISNISARLIWDNSGPNAASPEVVANSAEQQQQLPSLAPGMTEMGLLVLVLKCCCLGARSAAGEHGADWRLSGFPTEAILSENYCFRLFPEQHPAADAVCWQSLDTMIFAVGMRLLFYFILELPLSLRGEKKKVCRC